MTGRQSGSKNFSKEEIDTLLKLLSEIKPSNSEEWRTIVERFSQSHSDPFRTEDSLRKKFKKLVKSSRIAKENGKVPWYANRVLEIITELWKLPSMDETPPASSSLILPRKRKHDRPKAPKQRFSPYAPVPLIVPGLVPEFQPPRQPTDTGSILGTVLPPEPSAQQPAGSLTPTQGVHATATATAPAPAESPSIENEPLTEVTAEQLIGLLTRQITATQSTICQLMQLFMLSGSLAQNKSQPPVQPAMGPVRYESPKYDYPSAPQPPPDTARSLSTGAPLNDLGPSAAEGAAPDQM